MSDLPWPGYVHPVQEEQMLPEGVTLPPDVSKPYKGEITQWYEMYGVIYGDHTGSYTGLIRTSSVQRIFEHAGRKWTETRNSLYLLGQPFVSDELRADLEKQGLTLEGMTD